MARSGDSPNTDALTQNLLGQMNALLTQKAKEILENRHTAFRRNLQNSINTYQRQFFKAFALDIMNNAPGVPSEAGVPVTYNPGGFEISGAPKGNIGIQWAPYAPDYYDRKVKKGGDRYFKHKGWLLKKLQGIQTVRDPFVKLSDKVTYRVVPPRRKDDIKLSTTITISVPKNLSLMALRSIRKNSKIGLAGVSSTPPGPGDRTFLHQLIPSTSNGNHQQILYRLGNYGRPRNRMDAEGEPQSGYGRVYRPSLEMFTLYWLKVMPQRVIDMARKETFRRR